jgi:hypothetical protein
VGEREGGGERGREGRQGRGMKHVEAINLKMCSTCSDKSHGEEISIIKPKCTCLENGTSGLE